MFHDSESPAKDQGGSRTGGDKTGESLHYAAVPSANGVKEPDKTLLMVREAADDPHRLARLFLADYTRVLNPQIAWWRGDWYAWRQAENRYVRRDMEAIRAEITATAKAEFDKVFLEEQAKPSQEDEKVPVVKKISVQLINAVQEAIRSVAGVLIDTDTPIAWRFVDKRWPAEEMMAFRNCSIHVPSFISGATDYQEKRTPNLFCLNAVDYDFDPRAREPRALLAWLESAFPGDREAVDFVQELLGWIVDPSPWTLEMQKILLVAGPTRSGKGTLLRLIEALIGPDAVATTTLRQLGGNFGLAKLVGKRVLAIADARASNRLEGDQDAAIEVMLNLSGRDVSRVSRKYKEDLEVRLDLKQIIVCNHVPEVRDRSSAILGRFVCLGMSQSFLGREDDSLDKRLRAERAAILLWAAEGARRLKARGCFVEPASAAELREEAEDTVNPLRRFAREMLELDPSYSCPASDVFITYQDWMKGQGETKIRSNPQWLGRDLAALGLQIRTERRHDPDRHGTVVTYHGLRLRSPYSGDADSLRDPPA